MHNNSNADLINLTPTPTTKAKIKIKLTDTYIAKIRPPKRVSRGTKQVKLPKPRYYDTEVKQYVKQDFKLMPDQFNPRSPLLLAIF